MNLTLLVSITALAVMPGPAPLDSIGIARLQYEGGGDWYANPSSLPNLLSAIRERSGISVSRSEVSVRALDPSLSDHPYLYLSLIHISEPTRPY